MTSLLSLALARHCLQMVMLTGAQQIQWTGLLACDGQCAVPQRAALQGQHACCGTGDAALSSTAVHDQLARAQRQQQSSDIVLPEALAWRLGIHDDVENCHGGTH